MSNLVIASGILKGKFQAFSNDGIKFTLVVASGNGANVKKDEYTVVAYSSVAEKLKTDVESGNRIVFAGRVASEKMEEGKVFHNVINASKVLAITEADYGADYIVAVVSATAKSQDLQYTPNGAPVVNLNLASSRPYEDKDTKEQKQYTTYLDGTLWNALAEGTQAEGILPMEDKSIILIGTPRPNSYKNKEGVTVNRINVWAHELFVGKGVGAKVADSSDKPARASAPASGGSKFGNKGASRAPRKDVFAED